MNGDKSFPSYDPGPTTISFQEELLDAARHSIQWSVAPSSKFHVGAALLSKDKKIYTGCNIESPVYLGMCAERVALFKALSEGAREFVALAIVGEQKNPCLPCGTCRQLLWEFAAHLQILACDEQTCPRFYNLEDLLPFPFERAGHGPHRLRGDE
jgi:cytidine deaminase